MSEAGGNLPEAFRARVAALIPPEQQAAVLTAFSAHRPTTLRANRLRITGAALGEKLRILGIPARPVSWLSDAFVLDGDPYETLGNIMATPLYRDGYLYVQNLASMIPAIALDPQPGESVLDIAAAPGSKTTQMAAMMGNKGMILANDISTVRTYKLMANLSAQGVTCVSVIKKPGQLLWQEYREQFDRALVDAPCSLEGRISVDDEKSYRDWSMKRIEELSYRQKMLLRSAVACTKPGGVIVYATCTLAPEENEGVIDWLLKKEADRVDLEPAGIPGLPAEPAVIAWKDKTFDSRVRHAFRIYPSETMEGFFVAKIRKLGKTRHEAGPAIGQKNTESA